MFLTRPTRWLWWGWGDALEPKFVPRSLSFQFESSCCHKGHIFAYLSSWPYLLCFQHSPFSRKNIFPICSNESGVTPTIGNSFKACLQYTYFCEDSTYYSYLFEPSCYSIHYKGGWHDAVVIYKHVSMLQ